MKAARCYVYVPEQVQRLSWVLKLSMTIWARTASGQSSLWQATATIKCDCLSTQQCWDCRWCTQGTMHQTHCKCKSAINIRRHTRARSACMVHGSGAAAQHISKRQLKHVRLLVCVATDKAVRTLACYLSGYGSTTLRSHRRMTLAGPGRCQPTWRLLFGASLVARPWRHIGATREPILIVELVLLGACTQGGMRNRHSKARLRSELAVYSIRRER